MGIQFANLWVLLLIWLVPAAALWWLSMARRRERVLSAFVSASMQKKLSPGRSAARAAWQVGLLSAAMVLGLIAAARPQWGEREEIVYQRGRDLMIVLDVSRSMLAADVRPSRLQRAKTDIADLVRELRGDRAGLIVFRNKAVQLCPLTTDYAFLRQILDGASVDSAPPGETDIGAAIREALAAFEKEEGSHKAVVLVSDGEDLGGQALAAAEEAREHNIPIFTVGFGSRKGALIPDQKGHGHVQHDGQDVISRLDDDTLHAIARTTQAAYIPVGQAGMTSTTLGTLYRDNLRRIAARDLEESLQQRAVERYQWFLLPGILALLLAGGLSPGRLKIGRPKAIGTPAVLLCVCCACFAAQSRADEVADTNGTVEVREIPAGRRAARLAQKLYADGDYEAAAEAYLQAARGATETAQQDFRYNAAASRYMAGQFREAADLLRELNRSDRRPGDTRTLEGLGAALYRAAGDETEERSDPAAERSKLLEEAGNSFREAARTRQSDTDARHDLALVLQSLPEARRDARIEELTAEYGDKDAGTIAAEMLRDQRELMEAVPAALTNRTPDRITLLEDLAARQKANADLWIPLKNKLLQAAAAGSDPAQPVDPRELADTIESTRDRMTMAANSLRDLDGSGYRHVRDSETVLYNLWKGVAPFAQLLDEDLRWQTNTIDRTAGRASSDPQPDESVVAWQKEAHNLTGLFVRRFTESVPEQGPAPMPQDTDAAGTDQPGQISSEDRRKILDLAAQAAAAQERAGQRLEQNKQAASLAEQRWAYELLEEIRDLLPKQSQQQQQQKNQDPQEGQQQPQPDQGQQPEPDQPEEPQQQEQPEPQEEETPQDVRELLERALQREKEHQDELRRRDSRVPVPSYERDW